jgi:predicted nucleic acid-binding protein
MIVVSDTTPLNYLVLVGQANLLWQLYQRVIIPPAVYAELQRANTPASVKQWVVNHPTWLEVRPITMMLDKERSVLDEGECEALALAEEVGADLLLIDDRQGRLEARRRNLRVIGTLGVLAEAAAEGLIDLPVVIARLQQTSFYVAPELLQSLLNRFKQ